MPDVTIAEAIEQLAQQVEEEDDLVSLWAVAAFAIRLGVVAVVSTAEDPVEAMTEVGEMWADMVLDVLERQPERRLDVLRSVAGIRAQQARDVGGTFKRGRRAGAARVTATPRLHPPAPEVRSAR